VPAIRERMLASLVNVSADMTAKNRRRAWRESTRGHALGLGEIHATRSRQVVGTVTNGAARRWRDPHPQGGDPGCRWRIRSLHRGYSGRSLPLRAPLRALSLPASVRLKTADGRSVEATGTLENSPPVLFDALVLPDGGDGVTLLAGYGQTREFVTNHYRHGKTILALGRLKGSARQG
jgi:catalase